MIADKISTNYLVAPGVYSCERRRAFLRARASFCRRTMQGLVSMQVPAAADDRSTGDFRVGEWLVEPDLCQVSRDGKAIHVRPQLMDLLVFLARHAGRTVPHDELLATICPGQRFLADTALPRCIAELRQALGDRAGTSTVILTI